MNCHPRAALLVYTVPSFAFYLLKIYIKILLILNKHSPKISEKKLQSELQFVPFIKDGQFSSLCYQ